MIKTAIFFDLDGTLWDAIEPIKDSWNEAMIKNKKRYRFTFDDIKGHMGLTPEETSLIAFSDCSLIEGMKLFNLCLNNEISYLSAHLGKLYPNEISVLESLAKKYSLYIVSNSGAGYIENYLNGYNLNSLFKGHLCVGDTGLPKYQNIKLLKEKDEIGRVIYVGDTIKDKNESEKAGVDFIHAAYGFGKINDEKYYISSLNELDEKISEVLQH